MVSSKPKCQYYMESKKRTCKFDAKPGYNYCGNHIYLATNHGEERVPCPVDPRHTVARSELKAHVTKCPAYFQLLKTKAQPFFREDVHVGSDDEVDMVHLIHQRGGHVDEDMTRSGRQAAIRLAYARAIGKDAFLALVAKVEGAYAELLVGQAEVRFNAHVLCPPRCKPLLADDHVRPFSLKHAVQQASILGHLEEAGLLRDAGQSKWIEFGAGRGYLALMLTSVCDASDIVLNDRRGYRFKADRSLKQSPEMHVYRCKCDLKDLDVDRLPGMPAYPARDPDPDAARAGPNAAVVGEQPGGPGGSHGGAGLAEASGELDGTNGTRQMRKGEQPQDDAYRINRSVATPKDPGCCNGATQPHVGEGIASSSTAKPQRLGRSKAKQPGDVEAAQVGGAAGGEAGGPQGQKWVGLGKHLCGAATDYMLRACLKHHREHAEGSGLRGLAVAPCCHHRCSWRSYIGKHVLREAGFTPPEFELLSWMTGWALCGHESPVGGADTSYAEASGSHPIDDEEPDLLLDTDALQRFDQGSGEQPPNPAGTSQVTHLLSHQPHTAQRQVQEPPSNPQMVNIDAVLGLGVAEGDAKDAGRGKTAQDGGDVESHALGNPVGVPTVKERVSGMPPSSAFEKGCMALYGEGWAPRGRQQLQHVLDTAARPWGSEFDPLKGLPREFRMELGLKAKELIDYGRMEALRRADVAMGVKGYYYVDPAVSGENRLIVAVVR